jgi:hypothetical protein
MESSATQLCWQLKLIRENNNTKNSKEIVIDNIFQKILSSGPPSVFYKIEYKEI